MRNFLISTGIIWVIAFFVTFFTADDPIPLPLRLGGALLISLVMNIVLFLNEWYQRRYYNVKDSDEPSSGPQMISCPDCGYYGVGNNICPRCKSWRAVRLSSDTPMMSCRNCGYYGVGLGGICPRCKSTGTTRIK